MVLANARMNATTKNVAKYEALRIFERPLASCEGRKTKSSAAHRAGSAHIHYVPKSAQIPQRYSVICQVHKVVSILIIYNAGLLSRYLGRFL